jgi:antitoxin (DNA-binding transcriptional repressor) of toxin-antitoxin stability system
VGLATAVLAAAPAVAQTGHPITITATGTGVARVQPKNRKSNASIAAAVKKADKIANQRAFQEGRETAHAYARAAGRRLVRLVSVSDVQTSPFYGGGQYFGPFGPNRYCGKVRVRVGKFVRGQKPTFKKVRRCFVPRFETRTLTLTYQAR